MKIMAFILNVYITMMRMKKIRLTESRLRQIIKESVKDMLNEGTPRQNELLRKLTGSDKYDNLSVPEASAMISNLLDKQGPRSASPKQINFLLRRKQDWVKDVELTSEDASTMISALMSGSGRAHQIINNVRRKYRVRSSISDISNYPVLIDYNLVWDAETFSQGERFDEDNFNELFSMLDINVIKKNITFMSPFNKDNNRKYDLTLANNYNIPQNKIVKAKCFRLGLGADGLFSSDTYIFIAKDGSRWEYSNEEGLVKGLELKGLL